MKVSITVREYARLTTEPITSPTLDRAQVSVSAFEWLCRLNATFGNSGAALVQVEDRRWLKLDNYVGVVETPCGTRLEILPKHFEEDDCVQRSRTLLQRMISDATDLKVKEVGETSLQTFDVPLSEWVMSRFLAALEHLVKRGVRSDYLRIEAAERFLRGQLDIVRQIRQPPGRQNIFQIRHDVFLPDRPENRLLKSALVQVCRLTQTPKNWRLAHELRGLLQEIPASPDVAADFKRWRKDRLMAHYQPSRPWCELILNRQMPYSLVGKWQGISMLFPMEKLFERYVAGKLSALLERDSRLTAQPSRYSLCMHDGGSMFRMEPDLMIERADERWILDTKWKLLDAQNKGEKYGLSQADFYQLYAYGKKYLSGAGQMMLIYPKRKSFYKPLPVFDFGDGLSLWAVPFDLERGQLLHNGLTSFPFRPEKQFCEGASVVAAA